MRWRVTTKTRICNTPAARYGDAGTFVGAGVPVVRVVRADDLWVRFAVVEDRLDRVAIGRQVELSIPTTGARGSATIRHIAPELDASARMFFVEARLEHGTATPREIRAGLAARVSLNCAVAKR